MSAKEMFEKLGFEEPYHDDREIIYYRCNSNTKIAEIEFDLYDKTFYCDYLDEAMEVDMETLKAINQQCHELGWI